MSLTAVNVSLSNVCTHAYVIRPRVSVLQKEIRIMDALGHIHSPLLCGLEPSSHALSRVACLQEDMAASLL